ncbi:MAG: tetratricopeptide repeat protein [Minwuiales bacterium]|nr:tetratricopeptide repeat protein [Minwuiales bacterium]
MAKRRTGRKAREGAADIMAPVFQVPDKPATALSRAGQLHQAGRFNQAEALYMETSERWPDNADASHWLGILALQRGDKRQAAALIARAIAIDDGNPQFHFGLGLALLDDDPDSAIEQFSRALRIDPNFAPAREALAAAQSNRQGNAE